MKLLLLALVVAASGCTGVAATCDPPRHEIVVATIDGFGHHECVSPPPVTPPPTPAPTPTPTHPTVYV